MCCRAALSTFFLAVLPGRWPGSLSVAAWRRLLVPRVGCGLSPARPAPQGERSPGGGPGPAGGAVPRGRAWPPQGERSPGGGSGPAGGVSPGGGPGCSTLSCSHRHAGLFSSFQVFSFFYWIVYLILKFGEFLCILDRVCSVTLSSVYQLFCLCVC